MSKFLIAAGLFAAAAALVAMPVFGSFALSTFGSCLIVGLVGAGIVIVII